MLRHGTMGLTDLSGPWAIGAHLTLYSLVVVIPYVSFTAIPGASGTETGFLLKAPIGMD
jgi:hypothetical protein